MDILNLSVKELRGKLESREITCKEIVEKYFKKIDESEPTINAFISIDREGALLQAEKVDIKIANGKNLGKLAGITIGIKDNISIKDSKTTCGSKMLENYKSPYDASVIERIIEEDGIIVGKTNMDEFAMGSSTETSYFKKTKNPLDLDRVPGGSSGGSAAAVSSGQVLMALGTDTGGSVRQPASFCGVVGVKPTYGTISRYGIVPLANTLDQVGIFANSVEDATTMLNVLAKYDEKDSTSCKEELNIDENIFEVENSQIIKSLSFAIPKELMEIEMDEEVKDNFQNTLDIIRKNGGIIEEISIPSLKYALETYHLITNAEASANLARFDGLRYGYRTENYETIDDLYKNSRGESFGEEVKRRIMMGTYILTAGYADKYYLKALKIRTLIKEDYDRAFEKYDIILTPTSPKIPFKFDENKEDPVAMYMSDLFTVPVNLAGICGMTIPVSKKGQLSTGIQVIANRFKEENMIKAGLLIERLVK